MRTPTCTCFCFVWLVLGGAVSMGPQITSLPQSVVVAAGGTASLLCSMTGTPQPTAAWYKVGGALPVGRHSFSASNGTLRITGLVQGDTGQYFCVSSNDAGSVRSLNSTITVAYINSVSSPTQVAQTANLNDKLVVPCFIPTSVPSPTVTWRSGGTAVSFSSRVGVTLSGWLVYSYLISGDAATLTCTVVNSVVGTSQTTSQVTLTLSSATANVYSAMFVSTPVNQSVLVGATVMFDCFAVGVPIPTISWFKDEVAISSSSRVTLDQFGKILAISNATTRDGGAYSCKATQTNGYSITSAPARLTILEPPTIVQSFPKTNQNASLSSNLTCSATGTAPLMWTWLVNETVASSSRVQYNSVGPQSTLTFTTVRTSDTGVYQCLVQNPMSGAAAANEVFTVTNVLPVIYLPPVSQYFVFINSYIQLPCLASGYPPPTFQWTKADAPLSPNRARYNVSMDTGSGNLTIFSTLELDSAFYVCMATNEAGSVSSQSSFLRVIAYPTVFNITQTPATPPNAGASLTLWCSIQQYTQLTNPSYTITWNKDGALFHQTSGRVGSYLFSSLSVGNNGFYECFATILDSTGLSLVAKLGFVTLTVGAPLTAPSEPLNLIPSLINSTSFYLQWTAPISNGGIALRNYTIELSDLGNTFGCVPPQQGWVPVVQGVTGLSAWVTNLRPFSSYQARVVAYNSIKSSNASLETSAISTLSSAPSAPPTSVIAIPSSRGMTLSWQSPTPCSINDATQGYTIRLLLGTTSLVYQIIGNTTTTYSISGLQPNQTYSVQVAIYTARGTGPFSALLSVATPEVLIPTPPTGLVGTISSSTSVTLTWNPPSEGRPSTSYTVAYYQIDSPGIQNTVTVPASQKYWTVTGLMSGSTYNFSVFASNSYGNGEPSFVQVQLHVVQDPSDPIFQAPWFFPAVAGGGGGVALTLVVIVVVSCCCWCSRRKSKMMPPNENAVSSSGSPAMSASSGFSEFQRTSSKKKLKPTVLNGIMHIHSSPTPSRRSTDYADPRHVRTESGVTNTSSVQYGGSNQLQINSSMSALPPPPQYDGTLYDQRRHAVSPPCVEPPYMFREPTVSSSQLTQDSDESWAPAPSLNHRGHMTSNTHIDRSHDSFRSAASANSSSAATDEKPPFPHAAAAGSVVQPGWSNPNPHAHLQTLQENPPLQQNPALTADARNASQGDGRTWSGKQLASLSQQARSNSKTLHHGLVEHSQRLQPPQPMPSIRGVSDFKTSQGVVLPPPPPMDDMYPSGSDSTDRVAKGAQSKSSTLSSSCSSPKKPALDLGQLTKLNTTVNGCDATAVNPRLWQPQLLTKRNLEYSMKGYPESNNSSDLDDAESIASTYV